VQAAEYARMYELEDRYWWFVARRELALQFLRERISTPQSLLDVGCGTGAGQDAFSEFGEAFGVDFSQDALTFSHSRGLRRIARGNAEHLPFQDKSIDVVVTLDTLEHVPDDFAAIAEIARVLRPGGLVLINVPAYQWLWGPHDIALMHQRRYHRKQLRKLIESTDLKIERMTYHIFILFPIVALSRFLSRTNKGEAEAKLPDIPAWVEKILTSVQKVEAKLIRKFDLPWGSSIVAVARKKSA
jgi:ubiquinone/menaquinone biosynthesis C-methylase UbiE